MTINIKSPNNIKNYSLQRYVPYNKHDVYGTKCFEININDTSVFEILSIKATDKSNSEDKSISLYFRDFSSNNYFAIAKDVPIVESRQELLDESTPVYLDSASGFYQIWAQTNSANNTQSVFLDIEYREYNSTSTNYPTTVNNIITTNDLSYTITNSDTVYVEYQGNFGESDTINLSGDAGNNLDTYFTYPSSVSIANGIITPFSVTGNGSGSGGSTSTLYASTSNSNQIAIDIIIATLAGQIQFTSPGTYSWTPPAGVTTISAVCIGGGGGAAGSGSNRGGSGGGGGGLCWATLDITGLGQLRIIVGSGGAGATSYNMYGGDGGSSSIAISSSGTNLLQADGGQGGRTALSSGSNQTSRYGAGGSYYGNPSYYTSFGGNSGGRGGYASYNSAGGAGGGAAGYSGNGGIGSSSNSNIYGTSGAGGGGSGGSTTFNSCGGGGGVGIYGQGSNGNFPSTAGAGGNGGSGGTNGSSGNQSNGGFFGGGGGADDDDYAVSSSFPSGNGGGGAVRIIWGTGRAYPSTNTADV